MEAWFAGSPLWANLLFFVLGVLLITKGADWFTDGAVGVARVTGIPKVVVGATLVSLATTAPEFSVSVAAAWLGHPATSVGNAVGSTICNLGLILAAAALIAPVALDWKDVAPRGAFMIGLGVLLVLLGRDAELDRTEGLALFALVPLYLWFGARRAKREKGADSGGAGEASGGRGVGPPFAAGALLVVAGSVLLVQNAAHLARAMGVPELVIGLTLVAVGTSLPELVTAVSASLRGHGDIAVGNVIGANVLNVAWVLGGASLVAPLGIDRQSFVLDFPVMLLMMALFAAIAWRRRGVGRGAGLVLLGAYLCYLFLMFAYFA